jgi:cytosine/adenosine deaminase-related metal-dependent hydrolase
VRRVRARRGARAAAGAASGGAPGALQAATPAEAPLTPAAVLRMATLDGARALGWDHLIGSLAPGKRSDVIAVRLPEEAESGASGADPVAALVAVATASDVALTMVGGAILSEGGPVPAAVAQGVAVVRAKLGLRSSAAS